MSTVLLGIGTLFVCVAIFLAGQEISDLQDRASTLETGLSAVEKGQRVRAICDPAPALSIATRCW